MNTFGGRPNFGCRKKICIEAVIPHDRAARIGNRVALTSVPDQLFVVRKSRCRGQTMTELAMILPLLLILLFGIIQYGFIFAAYVTLRNAANVSARYATLSLPTPSTADIQSQAEKVIQPILDPKNLQTPSITSTAIVSGVMFTNVSLTYNLPLVIPYFVPGRTADNKLQLTASALMR